MLKPFRNLLAYRALHRAPGVAEDGRCLSRSRRSRVNSRIEPLAPTYAAPPRPAQTLHADARAALSERGLPTRSFTAEAFVADPGFGGRDSDTEVSVVVTPASRLPGASSLDGEQATARLNRILPMLWKLTRG